MKVRIRKSIRRPEIKLDPIRKAVEVTLDGEKSADCEVSVLLVNNAHIRKLNLHYRGIDSPTDVLAFAMGEGEYSDVNPELLGDIVISADKALEQAEHAGHSLEDELRLLTIHGTLHLLGYDHESAPDRAIMRRRERKYLKRLEQSGGEGP